MILVAWSLLFVPLKASDHCTQAHPYRLLYASIYIQTTVRKTIYVAPDHCTQASTVRPLYASTYLQTTVRKHLYARHLHGMNGIVRVRLTLVPAGEGGTLRLLAPLQNRLSRARRRVHLPSSFLQPNVLSQTAHTRAVNTHRMWRHDGADDANTPRVPAKLLNNCTFAYGCISEQFVH